MEKGAQAVTELGKYILIFKIIMYLGNLLFQFCHPGSMKSSQSTEFGEVAVCCVTHNQSSWGRYLVLWYSPSSLLYFLNPYCVPSAG